jgi:tRNA modification GTPase
MIRPLSPESQGPSPSLAVVTSPGRGAIAMVRVWGEGALAVVDAVFRPARGVGLARTAPGRLRVGRIGAGLGDEVVAVVLGGDPPEVEVQCHGGPAPVALVVEALAAGGARVRGQGAWARHSAGSPLRAEAALTLASAPTLRAAEILLDQAEGALDAELRRAIEADPAEAVAILGVLIGRSRVGVRLVRGWRVVLAGRPNVGKSRLLNALAGFDRAIVDPSPGTTRDVVTIPVALDGWPVELADTAGLRDAGDPIEAQGVALARDRQRQADLVVVVLDRSGPLGDPDHAILAGHPGGLVLANKCDLPAAWDEAALGALAVSAERGDGVEALVGAVAARLVPHPPPPGSGVPFRPIHARRLAAIRTRLASGDRGRALRSIGRWIGEDRPPLSLAHRAENL